MYLSTTASLQTAGRSNHPTVLCYVNKTAAFATTVLSYMDIRISGIFCYAGITGGSTYWEFPADTASRKGLWPICLDFPTLRNARISTFQVAKVDTGTALSTSDRKVFRYTSKQIVLQICSLQIHTANFNYRDRLKEDIPVVFHFFLGAGGESRHQNPVRIPVSLEIIGFRTA